jgi:hypothetical protein
MTGLAALVLAITGPPEAASPALRSILGGTLLPARVVLAAGPPSPALVALRAAGVATSQGDDAAALALALRQPLATLAGEVAAPAWWLEGLFREYRRRPEVIHGYSGRDITFDAEGRLLPAAHWSPARHDEARHAVFLRLDDGAILPPDLFGHLAAVGLDDAALHLAATRAGFRCRQIGLAPQEFTPARGQPDTTTWDQATLARIRADRAGAAQAWLAGQQGAAALPRLAQVPAAWGEVIDKITILAIKQQRLADPRALDNVATELAALAAMADPMLAAQPALAELRQRLGAINLRLWEIEDDIRQKEAAGEFDATFIALARAVYQLNDQRADLKRAINRLLNSAIVEEKSYARYRPPA